MANSDGGPIVVGVADDGALLGVPHLLNPVIVRQAVARFLPTGESPATLWTFELEWPALPGAADQAR